MCKLRDEITKMNTEYYCTKIHPKFRLFMHRNALLPKKMSNAESMCMKDALVIGSLRRHADSMRKKDKVQRDLFESLKIGRMTTTCIE